MHCGHADKRPPYLHPPLPLSFYKNARRGVGLREEPWRAVVGTPSSLLFGLELLYKSRTLQPHGNALHALRGSGVSAPPGSVIGSGLCMYLCSFQWEECV